MLAKRPPKRNDDEAIGKHAYLLATLLAWADRGR
jgi:hypothetical protein